MVAGTGRGNAAGVVSTRSEAGAARDDPPVAVRPDASSPHTCARRQRRKAQTGGAKRVTLGITDDLRISARPAEVEERTVPGHWEGDLVLACTGRPR
jgi:hypothetical protein